MDEILGKIKISKEDLLTQVRKERQEGQDFVDGYKIEIEADLKLLKNKRDKKKDEKLVGDSTLFNVHQALVARSFQSKNQIKLKGDKSGAEKTIKGLNAALNEDMESMIMKAIRYYQYDDIYGAGVSITVNIGWDGVYKRNIFQVVNPLTWIPDPAGDYLIGNYRYAGFFSIKTKAELKEQGYDVDSFTKAEKGAVEKKENAQRVLGLNQSGFGIDVFDIYTHFTHVGGKKIWAKTANSDSVLLEVGEIQPGSSMEEKKPEAIQFPIAFHFWKPDRNNPFGDRPANYIRDVQIQKAEIANLRLNKMRAELYPMYLYNKDYVAGKDLSFGFNKGIAVSSGIEGSMLNLQNIVQPIQRDLRVDTSFAVEQSLDKQVQKSTSIGDVVMGTTPERKETLGTNNLVQGNTDDNLQLNEEIHNIGDEMFVKIWFAGYYQNFSDGDKKLIYAGETTGQDTMALKRKDFIYEGNLNISIESNIAGENRKKKEFNSAINTSGMILPTLNPASRIKFLRFLADRSGMPQSVIDDTLLDTPNMSMQALENEALKLDLFVPIDPNDNDEEHLVEMGASIDTASFALHRLSHIEANIKKGTMTQQGQGSEGQMNAMANSMNSQAMSQANSQLNLQS